MFEVQPVASVGCLHDSAAQLAHGFTRSRRFIGLASSWRMQTLVELQTLRQVRKSFCLSSFRMKRQQLINSSQLCKVLLHTGRQHQHKPQRLKTANFRFDFHMIVTQGSEHISQTLGIRLLQSSAFLWSLSAKHSSICLCLADSTAEVGDTQYGGAAPTWSRAYSSLETTFTLVSVNMETLRIMPQNGFSTTRENSCELWPVRTVCRPCSSSFPKCTWCTKSLF